MLAERPASAPSSDTVRSSDLRRRLTSAPIATSSDFGVSSAGASDPVRSAISPLSVLALRDFLPDARAIADGAHQREVKLNLAAPYTTRPTRSGGCSSTS